jgi:16S rRNA (guanine527-N7)-methyltransferase
MEILARGSAELGLALSTHQLNQFQIYYMELAEWNQRVNLTAITGHHQVQVKHFLDSLTVLLALPKAPSPSLRVVDVGAGAGFPGLPVKLALPETHLTLVESVGKKARFLEHLVGVLGLSGVEVYPGRAEHLAHQSELRESFDLAISRGVARASTLLEYALPLCCLGGRVVLLKRGIEEELAAVAPALEVLGGRLADVYPVQVTGLADDGRVVVAVDKVQPTPEKYPRRPGMPVKRPL